MPLCPIPSSNISLLPTAPPVHPTTSGLPPTGGRIDPKGVVTGHAGGGLQGRASGHTVLEGGSRRDRIFSTTGSFAVRVFCFMHLETTFHTELTPRWAAGESAVGQGGKNLRWRGRGTACPRTLVPARRLHEKLGVALFSGADAASPLQCNRL